MRAPSRRVARRRRHAVVYVPLLVLGAAVFLAAAPTLNGAAMLGALILLAGTAGVVLESGPLP